MVSFEENDNTNLNGSSEDKLKSALSNLDNAINQAREALKEHEANEQEIAQKVASVDIAGMIEKYVREDIDN